MNQQGTRDLAWWRIPDWTAPATPRIILTGLAFGLLFGLVVGLGFGLWFGVVSGLLFGLLFGLSLGRHGHAPGTMGPLRWGTLISGGAVVGRLVVGLVVGLTFGLLGGLVRGLAFGLAFGLVGGLVAGLVRIVSVASVDDMTPSDPRESWRRDRNAGLVFALVLGLGFAVLSAPVFGLQYGLKLGFVGGFVGGLGFGLWLGLIFVLGTATWATALACAQSSFTHGTPLRMIRFLEDARARNVLRTVGPVYQFRHARLQDRLADRTPAHQPHTARPQQGL